MVAKSLVESLTNFDAASVITKALAASMPKLAIIAADQVKKAPDRISYALGLGFTPHLQTTFDKCYKIKTLIYRDEPVELLSQYVSIKLGLKRSKLTDNYVIENLEFYKNIIVQGGGGSGKTMFMKYLALCRFENPRGRIPLFIELRTLDYGSSKSIEQLIFEDSASRKSRMTFEQFEKALTAGLFLVILDGLDEVDPEKREDIHKQIIKMPVKYPDNILVISSREDPSLKGWNQFYDLSVLPLDKRQVTAVIRKIEFDKSIKDKFLKDLSSHLYEKHKSFLTNPLLATIMLLRYDQFANAGNKIHIFYDQAFETLFFKHDLSKGVYERKRYTSISVDDFKRFFAAFCFSTYAKNKYAFPRSELILYIEKALKYCSISASPNQVLKDLFESVCIIQEDGLLYTFVHRSFQEYFAALFVANYRGEKVSEYSSIIMGRNRTETAGPILKEMAPEFVNKVWALPVAEKILMDLSAIDLDQNPVGFILKICSRLLIEGDGLVHGFQIQPLGDQLLTLERYYKFGVGIWLTSNLVATGREGFSSIRAKLGPDQKEEFKTVVARINQSNVNGYYELSEKDNFWISTSNAPEILKKIKKNLENGVLDLKEAAQKYEDADDGLL